VIFNTSEDRMEKPAVTNYALEPIIARRWSPRAYDPDRQVADTDLATCLEAARWAPSCFNEQPWRFLIFDRHDPDALARARDCLAEGNAWAKRAPVLILSTAKAAFTHNRKPNRHAAHDVGAAALSLALQAAALGMFAHQMAGFDVAKTRAYFAIPDDYEPMAMIALGYYGKIEDLPEPQRASEVGPRGRRPLSEIAFCGRWDKPLV
jgi:nitroreductase